MIRCGDYGDQHHGRPQRRQHSDYPVWAKLRQHGGKEERCAKVQARHGGNGELEAVVGPRGAFNRGKLVAVQHVYVPVLWG